jgi:heparan-sulfate lyase
MKRAFGCGVVTIAATIAAHARAAEPLASLASRDVWRKLDLTRSELVAVRAACEKGDQASARTELLRHFRQRFPLPKVSGKPSRQSLRAADQIVQHTFQWGPYEAADYGKDVHWEWDPRGDIEWVAAIYRFYWARALADAYVATRDEKYGWAFVELTTDWIAKHPLEHRAKAHPVYKSWRGFAWLDIQTGIRADSLCRAFPTFVHCEAFTGEFLEILLASLYDHQIKTEKLPMNQVHNKAVFEQRGFISVAAMLPEFADSPRWLELAAQRTRDSFLAQVTGDGVQREWSFGYNLAVLRDAVDIMRWLDAAGVAVPDDYRQRVRRMYDYIFAIATPELAGPMFGDASRTPRRSADRARWPLYNTLVSASELLRDPKYAALARLDRTVLPVQKSYAFPEAGMYVMRNDWGPEQIYCALHCSPPAISGHDQPDNGTFELCAFGRWLMPDTGFYTYGHDAKGRAWHRQTRVHQTLTLDGKDSRVAAKHRLWKSEPSFEALAVENDAYRGLVHRRSVWFVDRKFFVLLDEAIGDAKGTLELHFQLAPGDARIDTAGHWAATAFPDANVLVWADPAAPAAMNEEEGWFAWEYGSRQPRKAFAFRHPGPAPAVFLTVLFPYRGTDRPSVKASLPAGYRVGADRVELTVATMNQTWRFGRDLATQEAWCTPGEARPAK